MIGARFIFVYMIAFAVLLGVRAIPPGQPLFLPPSICPASMESWDQTGDGTVDEIRFILDEECNLKHEDMMKDKDKPKDTKTIYRDL
jgi:hypothetical protein